MHTGAQIIVRLLERQGVTTVTGIPGGMNLPLYDALAASKKIRHVLARHEQGAGFIAQGMARASGLPAVCLATSGPGVTNLLTALADAKCDSVPLVAITGQVPVAMIGTDAFQEVDTYGMTVPICKHNFLVRSARELLDVLPRAFAIAASGRPGPVVVDVPKDVQTERIGVLAWPEPGRAQTACAPADCDVERAAALLAAAQKPLLVLGGGVVAAGAGAIAALLAEKIDAPAAATLMGLGAVPFNHPLSLGMLGMHGARSTNLALEECDVLVAAGVRFDDRATGRAAAFCPRARVVHLDVDPGEIGKIRRADAGLAGDCALSLRALYDRVPAARRPRWRSHVERLCDQDAPWAPDSPQAFIRRLGLMLPEDAVAATDVGQHQMWAARAWPHRRALRFLTSGGLGTMGFGLPAAIGAALSRPGTPVVCLAGDGSLLMNVQELATAAELRADVKVFVFNNGGLGLVRQQQDLFYGGRRTACRFEAKTDYVRVARGFGLAAVDLSHAGDPERLLKRVFETPGPCLVNVPVNEAEKVLPMVPPGEANANMIGGEKYETAIV